MAMDRNLFYLFFCVKVFMLVLCQCSLVSSPFRVFFSVLWYVHFVRNCGFENSVCIALCRCLWLVFSVKVYCPLFFAN